MYYAIEVYMCHVHNRELIRYKDTNSNTPEVKSLKLNHKLIWFNLAKKDAAAEWDVVNDLTVYWQNFIVGELGEMKEFCILKT